MENNASQYYLRKFVGLHNLIVKQIEVVVFCSYVRYKITKFLIIFVECIFTSLYVVKIKTEVYLTEGKMQTSTDLATILVRDD